MASEYGCARCGVESDKRHCLKCGAVTSPVDDLVKHFGTQWQHVVTGKDFIHGFPVIASAEAPLQAGLKNRRVILVDRGEDAYDRYVTAVQCYGDDEWCQGHYIDTYPDAMRDFIDRVRSECYLPADASLR